MKTGLYHRVSAGVLVEGPRVMQGSWVNTTNMECYSDDELLALFGWLPEVEVKPELAAGETYDAPVLVIAATQVNKTWPKRALTQFEQAAAVEATRLAAVDTAIQNDTTVSALKAMNNQEFDNWWAANVTNLAQANNVLKRIARIVLRKL